MTLDNSQLRKCSSHLLFEGQPLPSPPPLLLAHSLHTLCPNSWEVVWGKGYSLRVFTLGKHSTLHSSVLHL